MPSARDFGELIFKMGKEAKDGMITMGLVKDRASQEELCQSFESLDLVLQQELMKEKKKQWGTTSLCWSIHYARSLTSDIL